MTRELERALSAMGTPLVSLTANSLTITALSRQPGQGCPHDAA
jgi:hypothetical protein